jgi:hypothetical protein
MSQTTHTTAARHPWFARVMVVLLVLAVAVVGLTRTADARERANNRERAKEVKVNAKFEARSGIRITRIAVAGDGGLVDVRYLVLDPQKAHDFLGDAFKTPEGDKGDPTPKMRNTRKKVVLQNIASMHQHADLVAGQTYYMLFLNPGGKVKPGDTLDLRDGRNKDEYAGIPVG